MDIQEIVFNKTNDKGKKFIREYVSRQFIEIHLLPGSWFIAIVDNGFGYAMPYKNTTCSASHFGDKKYTEQYLKKQEQLINS